MPETTALSAPRVVVVGAGIGGLVSALLLSHQGFAVTLVDGAAAPGGKVRQIMVGGVAVDSGPTVFTMRWVFDQIFEQVGCCLDDLLALQPLNILARHAWRHDDSRLDLYADVAQSADAIARFSSSAQARAFLEFCAKAREIYQHLEPSYIRAAKPSLRGMAGDLKLAGLAALTSIGPLTSFWHLLGRYFQDPRLRQLFGRYATYCGASPWSAPATLMLIAHVEQAGVWSVGGGMHALAKVLAEQAQAQGASIRYGTHCSRIVVRDGRACGVLLDSGESLVAEAVVFNGDCEALAQGLLGAEARAAVPAIAHAQRSLSALTWSIRARTEGFALARHNVFFDSDYAREFDDIFKRRQLPARGTVYVCAQDRSDDSDNPGCAERLLCLVNAPPDGDIRRFTPTEIDACEAQALTLMKNCGLNLQLESASLVRTTPNDFNRLFPGTGGALYGRASHGWMTPFQRPSSSSALPGLYLAGGSVHPGPGVPMAALSGRLAAATVTAHLASTSRSSRVATFGGT